MIAPAIIDGRFSFPWRGYTSFGLFGRPLADRVRWVARGVAAGRSVFRVFSDTSWWPPDPFLDTVPKSRAVDATGIHPSPAHIQTVHETIEQAFVPAGAVLEYVILVTQFEELGPMYQREAVAGDYAIEVMAALEMCPNMVFELGNEVGIHGKNWGPTRVKQSLRAIRERWPHVLISCSSGEDPGETYGDYIYPEASWADLHYPRKDFPALTNGWPRFDGPVVDDEPACYPDVTISDYVRHLQLLKQVGGGLMTAHTRTGFVCDPLATGDLALLGALRE